VWKPSIKENAEKNEMRCGIRLRLDLKKYFKKKNDEIQILKSKPGNSVGLI
jgi:hypothetical protein